ncbi:hypothetical protein HWV62_12596 [Athelia sp. TMB]|nr:hypothetical protein HWV62_12596 [Athelia sp. TMB]
MSCSPAPTSYSTTFTMSSLAGSTAASSPPPEETRGDDDDDEPATVNDETELLKADDETRDAKLELLLQKTAKYSAFLKMNMDDRKAARRATASPQPLSTPKPKPKGPRKGKQARRKLTKRGRVESDESEAEDEANHSSKRAKIEAEPEIKFKQSSLVTGATLKDYQLEGVEWMVSLDSNGASGILADEMGLGKIPVVMYHGTPEERAELRRTVMRIEDSGERSADKSADKPKAKPPREATSKLKKKAPATMGSRRSGRFVKKVDDEDDDEEDEEDSKEQEREDSEYHDSDDEGVRVPTSDPATTSEPDVAMTDAQEDDDDDDETINNFPVVVTTYEMIIRDRIHLAQYKWGYVVVDEGHRLKNLDCRLMQEIKKYPSAGRMILTGTPLHNNLAELWSLLNFILPDIFGDLDGFQRWFNLGTMQNHLPTERSSQIVHSLHAILKPFLLRRLKADVASNLPPKKEYVLYAPLSVRQSDVYDRVLTGGLRAFLMGKGKSDANKTPKGVDINAPRKTRNAGAAKKGKKYDVDGDDDEYFEQLERGEEEKPRKGSDNLDQLGTDHQYKSTLKQVNNMKLQNTVMQLRKVCSHPFLFDWPVDPKTMQPVLNEDLVNASGKMMVLDRLLDELFRRKHKVLLFSQFTTMLDIIQDWAIEYKGWKLCRIDGSTPPLERREQMNQFQTAGDSPDAPILFLLSTRAGGLGITLTAADTVIFYDQDWNPQMDIQAQDRAHRIGQTKPVLIFRLITAHTIETKIMQKATEKRKLEALVIAKGKFKMPSVTAVRGKNKKETMAEMAASLLKLEGEKIDVVPNTAAGKANVISDEDLAALLDRSPEVFADRGKGWTSSTIDPEKPAGKRKAAFAVFEGPVDEGNDALAKLLGEDIE